MHKLHKNGVKIICKKTKVIHHFTPMKQFHDMIDVYLILSMCILMPSNELQISYLMISNENIFCFQMVSTKWQVVQFLIEANEKYVEVCVMQGMIFY